MIDKWFDDYGNGIELVQAAMDRTNTPNLKYIDGILKRWHEQQITTLEAVAAETAAHHHKRRQPVPVAPEEAADTKRREALMDEITEHDIENLRRLYNDNQNDPKPAH
jgi:DNA replication protein DnaD